MRNLGKLSVNHRCNMLDRSTLLEVNIHEEDATAAKTINPMASRRDTGILNMPSVTRTLFATQAFRGVWIRINETWEK